MQVGENKKVLEIDGGECTQCELMYIMQFKIVKNGKFGAGVESTGRVIA